MTRGLVRIPVWTWYCDRCGCTGSDLSWSQQGLPGPDGMRSRGWYVAPRFGDRCPACHKAVRDSAGR